jgi:hypothetical protein
VNPERRTTTFLQFEIGYPPMLPELQRGRFAAAVREFYPRAGEYYPFESCVVEGVTQAVIETEGRRRLDIARYAMTYQERVTEAIESSIQHSVELMELALMHFEIPLFIVSEVVLRQRWGAADSVSDALRQHAIKLEDKHFEPLGRIDNAGIHLVGTLGEHTHEAEAEGADVDDGPFLHWHLEVDPSQMDDNELFIELRTYFGEPQADSKGLADTLERTVAFLTQNVGQFIEGFMP